MPGRRVGQRWGASRAPTQVLFKGWGWKFPPPPNHPLTTEKRKTRPPALVNCHRKVATFPQRSLGKSVNVPSKPSRRSASSSGCIVRKSKRTASWWIRGKMGGAHGTQAPGKRFGGNRCGSYAQESCRAWFRRGPSHCRLERNRRRRKSLRPAHLGLLPRLARACRCRGRPVKTMRLVGCRSLSLPGSRNNRNVASSAATSIFPIRSARARGFFLMLLIAAALPTIMPACGPPMSLSALKQATSTPALMLSCAIGSGPRPIFRQMTSAPLPRSSIIGRSCSRATLARSSIPGSSKKPTMR